MAWFRKIKASLVKNESSEHVGEIGNLFFDIESGVLRLSDGVTPGGILPPGFLTTSQVLNDPAFTANSPTDVPSQQAVKIAVAGLQNSITSINGTLSGLISDNITDLSHTWSSQMIASEINTAITDLIDGAPAALDTLKELASALQNNPTAFSDLSLLINKRVAVDQVQAFTLLEKAQARSNIDVPSVSDLSSVTSSLTSLIGTKQDTLISGTNLKTINSLSLLGNGDLHVSLPTKAGVVANSDFTGHPRTATITFLTDFADSNYSVAISSVDSRGWTIENQTKSGFTINANANTALTGNVYWTASKHGEV